MKKYILSLPCLLIWQFALGCYCNYSEFQPYHYFNSTYIFEGKVISVGECKISFEIINNFRGELENKDAFTYTKCDFYCGIMTTFEVDQVWIMYGSPLNDKKFYTDGCTRSSLKEKVKNREIEMLKNLYSLNGYYKSYSADSVMISKGTVRNQNRESLWETYDKFGFRKQIVVYKNNKPFTNFVSFYIPPKYFDNKIEAEKFKRGIIPEYVGKVKSTVVYDKSGKVKVSNKFNKQGKLIQQNLYKNGKYHGHNFANHYSSHYKDGKRHGQYSIKHYKTEFIKKEGQFDNGKPVGFFKYYNKKGELIYKTENEDLQYKEVLKRIKEEN